MKETIFHHPFSLLCAKNWHWTVITTWRLDTAGEIFILADCKHARLNYHQFSAEASYNY